MFLTTPDGATPNHHDFPASISSSASTTPDLAKDLQPFLVSKFGLCTESANEKCAQYLAEDESFVFGPFLRYLINGEAFTWKQAAEHLVNAIPELKPRLASTEKATPLPPTLCKIDIGPAEKDLGITEWIGWQKTVEDTIKSLLEGEKMAVTGKSRGRGLG